MAHRKRLISRTDEVYYIEDLIASGKSYSQIRAETGFHNATIAYVLKCYGLKWGRKSTWNPDYVADLPDRLERIAAGLRASKTQAQIAREEGVCPQSISRAIRKHST